MATVLYLWRGRLLKAKTHKPPLREVLKKFDYLGIVVFAAASVSLLLGLQFGGSTYSWSNGRTIASLTVGGVLFVALVGVERWKGNDAMVPSNVIGKRVVGLSCVFTSTLDGAYFILAYQVC
jgi:hypothetical protein